MSRVSLSIVFLRFAAMSWSSYCDNLVASGAVDKAAVCGLDDGSVWSQTAGFNVSAVEALTIAHPDIRFDRLLRRNDQTVLNPLFARRGATPSPSSRRYGRVKTEGDGGPI